MKVVRWLWLISLPGMLLALSAGVARADSLPDVIQRIKPSIVAVGYYDPTGQPRQMFVGTGFVVGNGHEMVTALHVLPKALNRAKRERIAVYSGGGQHIQVHLARVLVTDREHDLALLYVPAPLPPMQLASSTRMREGEVIAFTGFPLGVILGMYPVTHRGIISAITPMAQPQLSSRLLTTTMIRAMRNGDKVMQLDAIAYPGNSGSPVYDEHSGKVLGVVNSVFVKGDKESILTRPSGITYAIPVKYVHELLREAPP